MNICITKVVPSEKAKYACMRVCLWVQEIKKLVHSSTTITIL